MPTHPLTHHEILGLVEPFTRRGRRVDLGASNRLERRLAFKPIEHTADGVGPAILSEALELEDLGSDRQDDRGDHRLTRVLTHANGLEARLAAEGPDPGELLSRIESVPPQRQFLSAPGCGKGCEIALSHRLERVTGTSPGTAPVAGWALTHAVAQLDGLTLTMRVPQVHGIPADLELRVPEGDTLTLPEDLLAVLGWDWARLERSKQGWTSTLRLRGSEPRRSRAAEARFEQTARHLAQTLAEPPGRFHERRAAARWGVALWRTVPLLTCVGLIAGAVAVPSLGLGQDSVFRMLIFHAPPLLLMLGICLREIPRIEIPPLPRASRARSWRVNTPSTAPE